MANEEFIEPGEPDILGRINQYMVGQDPNRNVSVIPDTTVSELGSLPIEGWEEDIANNLLQNFKEDPEFDYLKNVFLESMRTDTDMQNDRDLYNELVSAGEIESDYKNWFTEARSLDYLKGILSSDPVFIEGQTEESLTNLSKLWNYVMSQTTGVNEDIPSPTLPDPNEGTFPAPGDPNYMEEDDASGEGPSKERLLNWLDRV